MHTKGFAFLILLVIALWPIPSSGQVDVASAALKGTITDQNNAVIPGVNVTATSLDKGIIRTARTGPEGTYHIPVWPPGKYKLDIEANGITRTVDENVQLTVGQRPIY